MSRKISMNSKINSELDAWIITYMATLGDYRVTPYAIISKAPQQLAVKIPNERTLVENLFALEQKGLIHRQVYAEFELTNDGLLEYRKYINPLWELSRHKPKYENILDKTDGDIKSKESVKRILKKIRDLTIEQAYGVLTTFLKQTGNESIYLIIRILSELTNSASI